MAPVSPPTRPHSGNPHIALNPSVFPSSSRPSSRNASASITSFIVPREAEWEDAWDSSSDPEDAPPSKMAMSSKGVPIPTQANGPSRSEVNVAASWASTSYQHILAPSRPTMVAAKTYTDGVVLPSPGTVVNGRSGKLPPGGAWEIVESADVREAEAVGPIKVGKEAVREDVEEILKGVGSLHATPKAYELM